MNKYITRLWTAFVFGVILLVGSLILRSVHVSDSRYLAEKYGIALGPGVPPKIRDIKLGFRIYMAEPMEIRISGSRSLVSPVGSSYSVDNQFAYYEEERLISINSNGCAIRFVANWQPLSKQDGGQAINGGNRSTNTVFFYFGKITQTNISGLRVTGRYED